MLDKNKKEKIIAQFKTHASDSGSVQVQIAILTAEIEELTEHLKTHRKDFSSRRGLFRKVSQRKKLLWYLEKEDETMFEKLVKKLKIKVTRHESIKHDDDMVDEEASGEEELA